MGIYIHIPFCKKACHYCNFFFSVKLSAKKDFIKCLIKEIKIRKNFFEFIKTPDKKIKTIYFGGGTPSLLNIDDVGFILSTLYKNFELDSQIEITFEMNPDDASYEYLSNLKKLGVTRLSMGIQSFNDEVLKKLNRTHNSKEAHNAILNSRRAGFENINLDLIYSIPNRCHELWEKDIKRLISYKPEHISSYSLTVEKETYFGYLKSKNKLKEMSNEDQRKQYDILIEYLNEDNYIHYEVSNFCKEDKHSRHNLSYWSQKPYLGLGPSAHSYNLNSRMNNIYSTKKYIEELRKNNVPYSIEILSQNDKINEYIMTCLRTNIGLSLKDLEKEFNFKFCNTKMDFIKKNIDLKYLKRNNNKIHTTQKGFILSDKIISNLFVES